MIDLFYLPSIAPRHTYTYIYLPLPITRETYIDHRSQTHAHAQIHIHTHHAPIDHPIPVSPVHTPKMPSQPQTQMPTPMSKVNPVLETHKTTTAALYNDPHNPHLYLERGVLHAKLGFWDLAAADSYRALSLLESVVDPEGCEFHARRRGEGVEGDREGEDDEEDGFVPITKAEYDSLIGEVYNLLVKSLLKCRCYRDAYDFCARGIELFHSLGIDDSALQDALRNIKEVYTSRREKLGLSPSEEKKDDNGVDPRLLPAQGVARRVLYPWNGHEPDRKALETLELLNERLKDVAPKCEVKAVALPALHGTAGQGTNGDAKGQEEEVSIQLGLFAKEDIAPDEILLRETSLLTATNRLHDDLCDACNSPLPDLSSPTPPVPCGDCEDTVFCSQECHDQAQRIYHGAICGMEGLASIGRDIPDPKDKADYLYLLLLGRALAMAATQEKHPLDLPETKYIWGDFCDFNLDNEPEEAAKDDSATLPFSFHLSILQPIRLLEEMGLDPYATLPTYDTWILNTLYAKFRGTASGRLSTWDGGPELCAVHPLWCLANHSCDPNVRWEWGGEITFRARSVEERPVWRRKGADGQMEERKVGKEGIEMGEEILNHYCDVDLSVKDRREWAVGALGGMCLCERCVWEDS